MYIPCSGFNQICHSLSEGLNNTQPLHLVPTHMPANDSFFARAKLLHRGIQDTFFVVIQASTRMPRLNEKVESSIDAVGEVVAEKDRSAV